MTASAQRGELERTATPAPSSTQSVPSEGGALSASPSSTQPLKKPVNPHNLTVGQELWYVPGNGRRRDPGSVTVQKIGRVWAEISREGRISLETLWVDGGNYTSLGRCYLSKELHDAEILREQAWGMVYALMRHQYAAPKHLTTEEIRAIFGMLNRRENNDAG